MVSICEVDASRFKLQTSHDVWRSHDSLQLLRMRLSNAEFEKVEKAMGLNYNPRGVLSCPLLRRELMPIECSMYETMHVYFSHGIAAHELHLFLRSCKKCLGVGFGSLELFCSAGWCCPKSASTAQSKPAAIFSAAREDVTQDGFKGVASEVLAVYGLVQHFAETIIAPRSNATMAGHLQSFLLMCDIVQLLQQIKRQRNRPSDIQIARLRNLQHHHMQAFLACYGAAEVKPKHHFSRHIPNQLETHGFLYDAWACERKHRTAKRIGTDVANTKQYEKSLLARVLQDHLQHIKELHVEDRLLGTTFESDALAASLDIRLATVSESMQAQGITLHADDIIDVHGTVFKIAACVEGAGKLWLLVRSYIQCGTRGNGKLWKPRDECLDIIASSEEFIVVDHWSFLANDILLTLPVS